MDYTEAWIERTKANGGITPDNVGPNGEIGERMGGEWWGGYYGWRWPHGSRIVLESTLIAGSNALLLTGDEGYLDLHRSQWDMLWSLGLEEDGVFKTPNRHGRVGWFDYQPPDGSYPLRCFALTHSAEDRRRVEALGGFERYETDGRFGKGGQFRPGMWTALSQGVGDAEASAERMMEAAYMEMGRRLETMRADGGDPQEWDVHHWQDINPAVCEPIAQLSMGSPGAVYHGGLLHASVRYFDAERRRPGLPKDAAAAVLRTGPDFVELDLANCGGLESRDLIVQAGAFGEHAFVDAETLSGGPKEGRTPLNGSRRFRLRLGPQARGRLRLRLRRWGGRASYAQPF